MANPRRAYVIINYDGKTISEDIAVSDSILTLTYVSKSQDEADELELTVHDREGKWRSDWYPKLKIGGENG